MKGNVEHFEEALSLLSAIIRVPSFSGQEGDAIRLIDAVLHQYGVVFHTAGNNRWMVNRFYDDSKTTILLNSHIDTVRPNAGYTRDPFQPTLEDGRLYGLGSNDAGASLVCLLYTFLHYYETRQLPVNLCMSISAEEETSGPGGMQLLRNLLPAWQWALVGEPTGMEPAIAEKGLMVIDATVSGTSGHAAHVWDDMAVYKMAADIARLQQLSFPKKSDWLGPVKVTATQVQAGSQHNVVPAVCTYVLDVRLNEQYTPEEVLAALSDCLEATLVPRSMRLRPSFIDPAHPVVLCMVQMGKKPFGSSTLSDQSLLNGPSCKMGPGDTTRSHQPDEYILLQELEDGLLGYRQLLEAYFDTVITTS